MALSGVNTLQMDSRNQVRSIVEWSATQSIVNNTSTITANVYAYFTGAIYSGASHDRIVNIAGQSSTVNSAIGSHPNGVKKLLATVTKTVAHNSVGDLTAKIKVTNPFRVTYAGQYINQANHDFNIFLNKIDRESSVTATANVTIPNSNPSFKIVAQNSAFRHIADLQVNSESIATLNNIAAGDHTFTLNSTQMDRVMAIMKNTTTMKFEVIISTWSKSTTASDAKRIGGYPRSSGNLNIHESIAPTITSVTHTEASTTLSDKNLGVYIDEMSRVRIRTVSAGIRGSTIKSVEVTSGGSTYNGADITTDIIVTGSLWSATIKVTDTRGRTASQQITMRVEIYNIPRLDVEKSLFRVRADYSSGDLNYVPDPIDGNEISGTVVLYVSNLNDKNQPWNYKIERQKTGDSTWELIEESTSTYYWDQVWGEQMDNYPIFSMGINYSPLYSWVLRFTVTDLLSTTQMLLNVPSGFTIMDYRNNGLGLAIGKPSERDEFEVAMPTRFLEPVIYQSKTNNPIDNKLIRFNRSDGSQLAQITFDENTQDLNLHMYGADGVWKNYISFGEDGSITGSKIKDYVIEQGSNSKGSWEKWASGKLVQTMTKVLVLNSDSWQYIPLPQQFVGAYSVDGSLVAEPTSGTRVAWYDNMHKFTFVRIDSTNCAALIRGVNVVGSGWSDVVATGRWK